MQQINQKQLRHSDDEDGAPEHDTDIMKIECSSTEHPPEQTAASCVLPIAVKAASTQASHEV